MTSAVVVVGVGVGQKEWGAWRWILDVVSCNLNKRFESVVPAVLEDETVALALSFVTGCLSVRL